MVYFRSSGDESGEPAQLPEAQKAGFDHQSRNVVPVLKAIVEKGGFAAIPSDSVYGMFCLYGSEHAAELSRRRGRAAEKPFLSVIGEQYPWRSLVKADSLKKEFLRQIETAWPGRITFIFLLDPEKADYPPGETIALRMVAAEDAPLLAALLAELQAPLLAPSLNRAGEPPVNEPERIFREFGGVLDAVVVSEDFQPREPSAIIDLSGSEAVRLR